MKKRITILAALLVCGVALAETTIKTEWTIREVRDPRQLRDGLAEAFTGVNNVIATLDPTAAVIRYFQVKGGTAQDARIDIVVNNGAANGNSHRLLVDAAGDNLIHQTDAAGSMATQLQLGKTGIITMKGGATLDNTASATELNITETAVKVTGNFTSTGTTDSTGNLRVNTDKFVVTAANGNTAIDGTLSPKGDFKVNTDKFVVTAENGNTTVAGTFGVTGNTTLGGTTRSTGNLTVGSGTELVVTAATGAIAGKGNVTIGNDSELVITAANGNVASKGTVSAPVIQAGANAAAGHVDIFPATTGRGKIRISAGDAAADHTTTITRASQGAARTYTIPDAGGAADFVMTAGDQTIAGNKTLSGNTLVNGTFGAGMTDGTGLTVDADGDVGVGNDLAVVGDATIGGTLEVTGVATFTEAPVLTELTTAGTNTVTMTNAPDVEEAAEPVWITITIGADDYVIPAFKLNGE